VSQDSGTEKEQFDPLQDIKVFFYSNYTRGTLPVILMAFSCLYNLVFFSYPVGYELYLLLPIVGTLGLFISQYWTKRDSKFFMILAIILLLISAGLDSLVSFTYIFFGSSIQNLALPTLLSSLAAILAFIGWLFDYRTDFEMIQTSDDNEMATGEQLQVDKITPSSEETLNE